MNVFSDSMIVVANRGGAPKEMMIEDQVSAQQQTEGSEEYFVNGLQFG